MSCCFFVVLFILGIVKKKRRLKMSIETRAAFEKVKPIILKLKRHYYIQLWDRDDWLQEGHIILLQLLERYPELIEEEERLHRYFKTKFSSYLKDLLRRQESQKRQFHKLAYEEIGEVAHAIPSRGLWLDDYVAYQEVIASLENQLNSQERMQFQALIRGERFKGRRALLRKISPYFKEFAQQL
ncbi:TPA: sigma-70 family RNA polymerase sigma factor [Streptococcus pyogenes]|uniref:sigma-70 family RNA polymerase sigma factor n=1 Tax=Streptococcus pyogenes TaxID=1314 RepID=UPI0010A180FE|nr:sigma-70 family RNA polymerase sigma factor [Streptococcus pyogenes]QCK70340.1 sigma-70 family RNA polymerase sigma factor [Streptococcus pyogenes]QCK71518.1 sigma-70 family RNA polymerase sigma factor [Streptococcus pyogenes]HEP1763203.1 sigma-70 family RNA polymerase sigma factor [Streptococcus pyogenes]HEP2058975.1 sigma-70 family RNA polymerase sigma factor [Streptococcus pyogenes]HEP2172696.1 sigma-70 family RNA polymerase sigma factor [Streptococcus pyogenes]